MGYYLIPDQEEIRKLVELAGLYYYEAHQTSEDVDVSVNHKEETITVNGTFCEIFTFDELYRGKAV